jgi:hypothetical protein
MDNRLSKPKRKSAHPSQEEKEAMTATLEKARLKDERPSAQPLPLEPSPSFELPAEDSGTAAPPLNDFVSKAAAAHTDYDYGGRYGGYQATRFNSTLMNDQECDARAEYNFQASSRQNPASRLPSHRPSSTPTHMATAIMRPVPRHRERAQRRKR